MVRSCPTSRDLLGKRRAGGAAAGKADLRRRRRLAVGLGQGQEFLRGDLADRRLCHFDDEVDDLVLQDRRTQRAEGVRVAAVVVDDLPLVPGMPARLAQQRLVQLFLTDSYIVTATDFRQQQPEPDAALGKTAIFGRALLLFLVLAGACAGGRVLLRLRRRRELRPQILEFELDHARRNRKIIALGKLVEQRPLQAQAGRLIVIALQALPHLLAQLVEGFKAGRLSQRIVDRQRQLPPHLFDPHREEALLAGEVGGVIRWKGDAHEAFFAGARAQQLLLEAGQQLARPELDPPILAARPGNLAILDPALDIGDDDVAALGRAIDGFALALLLGKTRERPVDLLFGDFDGEPLDVEIREIRLRDVGQQFDRQRVFEIGALAERYDVELGRQGRTQIVLADRRAGGGLDRALQHLAENRCAVALAQDAHRHLARAEPRNADLAADLFQPFGELSGKLARRHDDAELALEPVAVGFGHLHQTGPLLRGR